jgi:hypothetical protein
MYFRTYFIKAQYIFFLDISTLRVTWSDFVELQLDPRHRIGQGFHGAFCLKERTLFSIADTAQMVQNFIYDISLSGECRFNLASSGGRNARDRPSCSFYASDEHILDPRDLCKDLWCDRGCLGPRKRLPWHRDGFDKGIRSNEGFSCLP